MKESGLRSEPFSLSGKVSNKESGLHGRPLFHKYCSFIRRSGTSTEPLLEENHNERSKLAHLVSQFYLGLSGFIRKRFIQRATFWRKYRQHTEKWCIG